MLACSRGRVFTEGCLESRLRHDQVWGFLSPWTVHVYVQCLRPTLVTWGITNYHKLRGIKQWKCILSQFWRPEIQNPGVAGQRPPPEPPSPLLASGALAALACGCSIQPLRMASPCVSSLLSPRMMLVIGFRVRPDNAGKFLHPNILTLITSVKTLVPNKVKVTGSWGDVAVSCQNTAPAGAELTCIKQQVAHVGWAGWRQALSLALYPLTLSPPLPPSSQLSTPSLSLLPAHLLLETHWSWGCPSMSPKYTGHMSVTQCRCATTPQAPLTSDLHRASVPRTPTLAQLHPARSPHPTASREPLLIFTDFPRSPYCCVGLFSGSCPSVLARIDLGSPECVVCQWSCLCSGEQLS